MNYVIDTNVLIEIENGNKETLKSVLEIVDPSKATLYLSLITLSEFYFGLRNKSVANQNKAYKKLQKYYLLTPNGTTAILFSTLLAQLEKKGKNIPRFDLLIGSQAIENKMTLITMDSHFKQIPNLKLALIA